MEAALPRANDREAQRNVSLVNTASMSCVHVALSLVDPLRLIGAVLDAGKCVRLHAADSWHLSRPLHLVLMPMLQLRSYW